MSRKPSPHDLPPKKIALIAVVVIGSIVLGTIFTMQVPEQRTRRGAQGSSLGHAVPLQQSVGRETNGMVWIPSGAFYMGSTNGLADEAPQHLVTIQGFWMDKFEVTNDEFEKFIKATSYITASEKTSNPSNGGADWRHPDGPGSNLDGKGKLPVVHVTWDDAVAYTKWKGKRLPTEAEWEYAARGGLDRQPYIWGRDNSESNRYANLWQGKFPNENTALDGFKALAPVGSFPANAYGLYDMAGNAAEWCHDWYRADYYASAPPTNPPGPETSVDPAESSVPKRIVRGGSYLCAVPECRDYLPAVRSKAAPTTGEKDIGFRCVATVP